VAALDYLAHAGDAGRAAVPAATKLPDPDVVNSARETLEKFERS
jgi:hypothetical protein